MKTTITAVIIEADFLPSYGFNHSIFVIWAKPEIGNNVIVETFGSKKHLIKKFEFDYFGRDQWDISKVLHRKCDISIFNGVVTFIKYLDRKN